MSLPTTYSQGGPYQIPQEPRSRLSAMQFNVGNLLRNPVSSSVYSRSPDATATPTTRVPQQTTARMPQLPQFAFMRRERAPTDEEHHAVLQSTISADTRRSSMSSANHSQLDHSPVNRISLWRDQPQPITVALGVPTHHFDTRPRARGEEDGAVLPDRHPADVPLDPETEELANMVRHKRKRKGCRRCRRGAWVRKANGRPSLWSDRSTRGKCFACLISGIFLVILLGVCKSSRLIF